MLTRCTLKALKISPKFLHPLEMSGWKWTNRASDFKPMNKGNENEAAKWTLHCLLAPCLFSWKCQPKLILVKFHCSKYEKATDSWIIFHFPWSWMKERVTFLITADLICFHIWASSVSLFFGETDLRYLQTTLRGFAGTAKVVIRDWNNGNGWLCKLFGDCNQI